MQNYTYVLKINAKQISKNLKHFSDADHIKQENTQIIKQKSGKSIRSNNTQKLHKLPITYN